VIDLARGGFLARGLFAPARGHSGLRAFAVSFTLAATVTHVELVISNFPRTRTGRSVWVIRRVQLARSAPAPQAR
jgi:hypothetical protein